jgi:L-arabinose isomerase
MEISKMKTPKEPSTSTKPKVGLFSGGIETYWKDTGMRGLPAALEQDITRLRDALEPHCDVVYPGLVGSAEEATRAGRCLRDAGVDMVVMYHATYIDDAMSVALLREIGNVFPVLFLSQGLPGLKGDYTLTDWGRTWGVNSAVQLPGSLKRLWPSFRSGFVFGHLDTERSIRELAEYARAAQATRCLSGSLIGFLPHRSAGVPMYDTFPDEARMIGQTGIRLSYLYIADLLKYMEKVTLVESQSLAEELCRLYEVVEPSAEEIHLAAKQAIALEQMVLDAKLDALAIDMFPGLTPACGMLPAVGMARLIDQGVVVTSEGDLSTAVAGILLRSITGKPCHFWENLLFDEEENYILGGHEGGSAGFSMAKQGTRPKLRNTQYINYEGLPGAPHFGVLPDFITSPGPVTLVTFFRGQEGYEMRIACGESVDVPPQDVHYEHTVFRPRVPLTDYFASIAHAGTCHHFALVHAHVEGEMKKVAQILGMPCTDFTDCE